MREFLRIDVLHATICFTFFFLRFWIPQDFLCLGLCSFYFSLCSSFWCYVYLVDFFMSLV